MSSDEEPSTSAPSAKRRNYQQFYKKEWEEEFPGWLQIMVRNYERKTNRGKWSEAQMKLAIQEVLDGKKGYKSASKAYNVPQTTLERKVNQARKRENSVQNVKVPLGPITTVFSEEAEQIRVDYLKEMEGRLFGLSTSEFQKLAYELAVRNRQHKFNELKEKAGKDWLRGFLNRHPHLSLRKPENTSAARAAGFNSVETFFERLGKTLDENRFTPDRIYNCDETGVWVVPKSRSKVIAATGKKQVGALTSAERGTTITIEICFNAAGSYLPPMFIYPRKRMKPELLNGAPPNSWAECSDSGWITAEIFLKCFQKFVILTNASKTNPVMLILDGRATHTQNLQLIDEARKYGVPIICFPPHTTHKLQPADVGFMWSLSIFYDQALTAWLRSNPGKVVSQFQVADFFGQAFIRAATMLTAINAFKACGISPYNPHIFTEDDFIAAEATEIELNAEKEPEADTTH
ncbi:MFS-type transporter clz9-like [Coccinella septempunctata]|uniref:MFS-type transporter clz9-like n=1 Tax=Coccinella septempunctata TaxID=41139 RepID=UPI001D089DDB|nr:MFS-type transporter clz9-like [Coccinella septempunctata]